VLHRLSPGNGSQRRTFPSFRVPRLRSSLAGAYLTTQLGVAWLQSSNKGYSSRPYSTKTALLCSGPPGRRPTHNLQNNSKLQSVLLYSLWEDPTENASSCSYSVNVCDAFHCSVTVCLASDRAENTASGNSSDICFTAETRLFYLCLATCLGFQQMCHNMEDSLR
jgi:hypothetical protein